MLEGVRWTRWWRPSVQSGSGSCATPGAASLWRPCLRRPASPATCHTSGPVSHPPCIWHVCPCHTSAAQPANRKNEAMPCSVESLNLQRMWKSSKQNRVQSQFRRKTKLCSHLCVSDARCAVRVCAADAMPSWVRVLGTPWAHGLMSAAALLGPGREIVVAGWRSAAAGSPDMNTLVGLGATAAFGVSCVAAALPALGWRTFFEEPAMLLGVVLLGRTLERRAKLQASADMAALRVRHHIKPFRACD